MNAIKNQSSNAKTPKILYYLTFMSVETISMLGSNILDFVLIWWITITTKSALYLALSSFIVFGTQIMLSPIAGVYIDRWNRKIVIMLSDLGQGFAFLYLLFKFSSGSAVVNDVLLMMFIGSVFASFQGPAFSAIVPLMVEQKNIDRINSLSYFSRIFTNVIGAPLGALLLILWPISTMIWFNIATFLFAVIVVFFVKIPSQKSLKEDKNQNIFVKKGFREDFKDGLSIIKSKGMLGFFFVFPITNFFETPRSVLLPLLINYTYNGDAFVYALIISSFQLSVSFTAIIMSWKNIWKKADPAKVVLFGIFGIFIGSILLVIPNPGNLGYFIIIPILGMIIMGICSPSVNITMESLQHKIIPVDKQARVSGTSSSVSLSMIPPATLLTGFIIDFLGNEAIRLIIFTSCSLGLISMALIWVFTDLSAIKNRLVLNSVISDEQKNKNFDLKVSFTD